MRTPSPTDLQQLDLQLHLLEWLMATGIPVIFKNRPKTQFIDDSFDHFGCLSGQVTYTAGAFPQALRRGGCFLFQAIGSYSLYEGVTLTERPVVLLDTGHPPKAPAFAQVLRNRCRTVGIQEDERNRLRPVEGDFQGFLARDGDAPPRNGHALERLEAIC